VSADRRTVSILVFWPTKERSLYEATRRKVYAHIDIKNDKRERKTPAFALFICITNREGSLYFVLCRGKGIKKTQLKTARFSFASQ
jgi:hypothetical protein